jgi:hypothetical protein
VRVGRRIVFLRVARYTSSGESDALNEAAVELTAETAEIKPVNKLVTNLQ